MVVMGWLFSKHYEYCSSVACPGSTNLSFCSLTLLAQGLTVLHIAAEQGSVQASRFILSLREDSVQDLDRQVSFILDTDHFQIDVFSPYSFLLDHQQLHLL